MFLFSFFHLFCYQAAKFGEAFLCGSAHPVLFLTDPHPGNLLRTPDGKLCVLDFGLMTEVSCPYLGIISD